MKLNAVAIRGITECEALELVAFARERDLRLRFVAVMPLDAGRRWKHDDVFSAEELRRMIAAQWPLLPLERTPASTARVFRFAEGPGEIGFIPSVTEPYYADRDRIRLTADGQLRTCLFAQEETDLRGPLRPAPRTPSSKSSSAARSPTSSDRRLRHPSEMLARRANARA